MQIPTNPDNNDIREALLDLGHLVEDLSEQFKQLGDKVELLDEKVEQLGDKVEQLDEKVEQLDEKVEKLDYKFDIYQKGTDGMVRMATTIIIATASVVVLSSLSPAIATIVTALTASNN